jgi:hypothetical protein
MPKYTPEDGYLGSTDSDEEESTTSGDLNNPETMPLSSQREVDRHTWPRGSSSSKNDEQIEQRLKENEPERPKHKRSVEREIPESLRKLAPHASLAKTHTSVE